ncbi:MAG: outer membrane beta-barrel protein [Coraliomargaritaceae bacterium]
MKNKIVLASTFLAASSLATAEILINEFLSFEGFIDMSYQHAHTDTEPPSSGGSDNRFGVDQVEINWLFNFDKVTGVVDFAYTGSDAVGSAVNSGDATQLEQAYATYAPGYGGAITVGRFESMLGFEATEPTELYQSSSAYDRGILPGYGEGVQYTYASDEFFWGAALVSSFSNYDTERLGGSGDSNYALEVAASYAMDRMSFFLGGFYEDSEGTSDGSTHAINAYVTYEMGAWIFAGELNMGNTEVNAYNLGGTDDDAMNGLLMVNYAYSDVASITGRISFEKVDSDNEESSQTKWTLAHGYAFTDNLSLVTEVSFVDGVYETDREAEFDALRAAVAWIFAF